MPAVLKDVNGNPLVIGNKYFIVFKQQPGESPYAYNIRKDNDEYKGIYTILNIEQYGNNADAWCRRDSDESERFFRNMAYEFHPITGGRRKSRRVRKRFRRTRK
jgi:hypothetical protein